MLQTGSTRPIWGPIYLHSYRSCDVIWRLTRSLPRRRLILRVQVAANRAEISDLHNIAYLEHQAALTGRAKADFCLAKGFVPAKATANRGSKRFIMSCAILRLPGCCACCRRIELLADSHLTL